jgi:hypothetical protein
VNVHNKLRSIVLINLKVFNSMCYLSHGLSPPRVLKSCHNATQHFYFKTVPWHSYPIENSCALLYRDSRGQAEKEFKVEVEAIGKVRHKNLVRLVGYCAEGARRYNSIYMSVIILRWKIGILLNSFIDVFTDNSGCLFMNMLKMETWSNGCMVM